MPRKSSETHLVQPTDTLNICLQQPSTSSQYPSWFLLLTYWVRARKDSRNTRKVTWLRYTTNPTYMDRIGYYQDTTCEKARPSTRFHTTKTVTRIKDMHSSTSGSGLWRWRVSSGTPPSIIQKPKQSKKQKWHLKGSTGQRRRIQAPAVILINAFFLTTLHEKDDLWKTK